MWNCPSYLKNLERAIGFALCASVSMWYQWHKEDIYLWLAYHACIWITVYCQWHAAIKFKIMYWYTHYTTVTNFTASRRCNMRLQEDVKSETIQHMKLTFFYTIIWTTVWKAGCIRQFTYILKIFLKVK